MEDRIELVSFLMPQASLVLPFIFIMVVAKLGDLDVFEDG